MHGWLHQGTIPTAEIPDEPVAHVGNTSDIMIDPALCNLQQITAHEGLSLPPISTLMESLKDTSVGFLTQPSQVTSSDKLPPFQPSTVPSCALLKKVAFTPIPST
jgi:hypothetical protein